MSRKQNPPYASEVVDISSTNHTFTARVSGIYPNATGTIVAKLRGDAAARTWSVIACKELLGEFETVEKTNTTLTAAGAMIGFVNNGDGSE